MMRKGAPPGASPLNWKRVRNLSPRASSPRAPTECSPRNGVCSPDNDQDDSIRAGTAWGGPLGGSACDLASMGASRPTSALSVASRAESRASEDDEVSVLSRNVSALSVEGPTATGRSSSKGSLLSHSALSNFFQRSRPVSALQMSRSADLSAGLPPPAISPRTIGTSTGLTRARNAGRSASTSALDGAADAPATEPYDDGQLPRFALPAAISARWGRKQPLGTPPPSGLAAQYQARCLAPRRDGGPVRAAPHESVAARRAAAGHLFLPIATAPPLAAIMDSPRLGPLAERPPPPL